MKILYVEDEVSIREAVTEIFNIKGYEVVEASDGQEAVDKASHELFDIIVMDIMMPNMNGIEALKIIRENQIFTPIILLTAKTEMEDVVNGLSLGADDYIRKPFDASDLITRIEVLYRREHRYDTKEISFNGVSLNKKEARIYSDSMSLSLPPLEADIFRLLVRMKDKISSEELARKINVDKEDVEFHASCLQQKIGLLNENVKMEIEGPYYKLNKT